MAETPPKGGQPPKLTVVEGGGEASSSPGQAEPGLKALDGFFDGRRSNKSEGKPQGDAVLNLTDMGNAERLVRRAGADIRFCQARGMWLVWDGARWAWDDTARVMQLAKEATRAIPDEARQATDPSAYTNLLTHALESESSKHQHAMVKLASYEEGIPVRPDDLDAHPFLLNVRNGAVDLRTGKLRPHRKEDLLTKLAPVAFDPRATCPKWDAFLDQIMAGRKHLVAFLQRALGWALTGDVSEQVLFFLHGGGSNGKSTMLNVVMRVLGDYARQAPEELLLAKNLDGGHPTDKTVLLGARLVACMEIPSNRRFNEAVIKQLTGGDKISARFMRQDFFEFWPTHKLFVSANHKPAIGDTDHGIWRRILLVPFTVKIAKADKDLQLPEKLQAEASGILNWLVQGCLEWQRIGLQPPAEVYAATDEYREEEDALAPFFQECCVQGPKLSATADDLYRTYKAWTDRSGERRALSQKRFGSSLRERGYLKDRNVAGNILWRGLGLLERHRQPDPLFPNREAAEAGASTPQTEDGSGAQQASDGSARAAEGATPPSANPAIPDGLAQDSERSGQSGPNSRLTLPEAESGASSGISVPDGPDRSEKPAEPDTTEEF